MQTKTKTPTVIFVKPEVNQNAIVVRPPDRPAYRPPIEAQITINAARLIGRPVKQSKIVKEAGLGYGRVYAVEYEIWQAPDPVMPIPLQVDYTPRFICTMKQFVSHQVRWSRYESQERWYYIAEMLACRVMAAVHRLNLLPEEVEAVRDILWYAIAVPAKE